MRLQERSLVFSAPSRLVRAIGRFWRGQATSTRTANASVQLRDHVAIVPCDILTAVAPVTALGLQSVQPQVELITDGERYDLYATILDRVVGDAPDLPLQNDIAAILKYLVDPIDQPT